MDHIGVQLGRIRRATCYHLGEFQLRGETAFSAPPRYEAGDAVLVRSGRIRDTRQLIAQKNMGIGTTQRRAVSWKGVRACKNTAGRLIVRSEDRGPHNQLGKQRVASISGFAHLPDCSDEATGALIPPIHFIVQVVVVGAASDFRS